MDRWRDAFHCIPWTPCAAWWTLVIRAKITVTVRAGDFGMNAALRKPTHNHDTPMNRERIAWLVSVVLISLLAFQINGTLAHRDDDYAWVGTLVDIHRQVANNYVDG